jgi:hypothetical protein
VDPDGDPALRRALVTGFPAAVEWARSLGVPVGDEITVLRYGRGRRIDTAAYIRACDKVITSSGGEIHLGASDDDLVVGERGVTGVDLHTEHGAPRRAASRRHGRCSPRADTKETAN